jgi:nicotinamidase-related amidase
LKQEDIMTTLEHRPNTALLVVDMQNGVIEKAHARAAVVAKFVRGYDRTLVSDAHTTEDHTKWGAPPPEQVIAHTNLYWTYQTAPGRKAGTIKAKDVDFGAVQ